jgi:hypothetical protein
LVIANLQQPATVLIGPIDESTVVPPRPPVGFKLSWLPATSGGVALWPDDLDAAPPLDGVAYQIEHRTVVPPSTFGAWEPVQGDDNLVLGSRDDTAPAVRLEYGMDFDQVYPRLRPRAPGAGLLLHLSDVFGMSDPTSPTVRPAQPLGSYHQYQIRAMDAAGRVSGGWTLSNIARLEKHVPPPIPAGPQPPPPVDATNHLTGPTGPRARAIVAGAPGLTSADLATLGGHKNAILLEWGWRQAERDLDPTTAEFRVYSSRPLDVVTGTVTAVASVLPNWKLSLICDLPLLADECAGQWVTSGGHPFLILHNGAGTTLDLTVAPSRVKSGKAPVLGPVTFGRPLRPEHQRPSGWGNRIAIVPLTAAENYQYVFFDLLTLSPSQPRDAVWVGVSAADSQSYVPDELTSGPNTPRPGNESSIAVCTVAARYRGQPVFSVPPPLGDPPELVTDEPTGRRVGIQLDLGALLGGALASGAPAVLARCSADDIISRAAVQGGHVVLTNPDGTQQTIDFPNPGDESAVLATLNSTDPQRLANRYLLYLLVNATGAADLFERTSGQTVTVGPVDDRLAPKPGRFFYRVQAADALGHDSGGGAILPLVVRVPSTAAGATPTRQSLVASAQGVTLTVVVPADYDTTHVLLFCSVTPATTTPPSPENAELLRLPNRRDLYPQNGLRLELADGTLLAPNLAKDLSDLDVTTMNDGSRVASLAAAAAAPSWVTLWCCGLTRDGFPSALCGPFGSGVSG